VIGSVDFLDRPRGEEVPVAREPLAEQVEEGLPALPVAGEALPA